MGTDLKVTAYSIYYIVWVMGIPRHFSRGGGQN